MTSLCNVPPGFTLRVQVVDVTVNKPFKYEVRRLFENHLDKYYLELYVQGKLSVVVHFAAPWDNFFKSHRKNPTHFYVYPFLITFDNF